MPSGRGTDSYENLKISADEVFSALDLLQEYASKTDPSVMEFLTVDGPQDAIHLFSLMKPKNAHDLPEARP
ncbi:MAG TPA: hypothetical protein VN429_04520 [Methanospirillum sp.]|uniref:hypothetical protein n=1 Tax=Methanospirillum sp. TaxID=45200 RepID=UPI002C418403|nr:hypothetical protein [Methanospirillum sp.]HWQ63660.1 hypothetical protein [Methanospirillum sp.]